jgi:hypothetical protein
MVLASLVPHQRQTRILPSGAPHLQKVRSKHLPYGLSSDWNRHTPFSRPPCVPFFNRGLLALNSPQRIQYP